MKRDLLSVKKTAISFFCLFSFLFLVSCESLSFYSQAIRGQLSILSKRENIQALIADPATDAALKQRLSSILEIREFAETSNWHCRWKKITPAMWICSGPSWCGMFLPHRNFP